ncbi:MAG: radical SAM protein [Nanoarchaeota archaeon]|nr:B12-binding domain-containing radical SAM protein [Nanoarchaeota archaeon]
MKILLINSPTEGRIPAQFPLGLGYIAKVLLNEGYQVEVLDIWSKQYTKEQIMKIIPKLKYDLVGINAISVHYNFVKWLSKKLKEHHSGKIILGGALPTFSSEIVLKNTEVDICVLGEGEITIINLLNNWDNISKVNGIHYKNNGKIIKNTEREYIKNLDIIPFPAWELFPIKNYLKTPASLEGYGINSMNIISARGCPYRCEYCSKTFKSCRLRSVDNIIEEIKELKKRYGIKVIDFNDELVLISKSRMLELCKKIALLKIKWTCQGRTNVVDYEMLSEMKKAGCYEVGYGIESGSQKILDNMKKDTTVEIAIKAVLETKKAGIKPALQSMFGYTGENHDTIKETIEFYNTIHDHPASESSITTPFPGTVLYDNLKQKGLIKDEEKYLEDLKETGQYIINLTEFPDNKVVEIRNKMDKKILQNYYKYRRRHPVIFLRDYSYKFKRFFRYVKHYGLMTAAINVFNTLKTNPGLIFQSEY